MNLVIIPFIVLVIIGYGLYKKIDIYESFGMGVKEGLKVALRLFPTVFSMTIAIDVLIKSNFLTFIINIFNPILTLLKFPKEIFPLAIMRPISGSSSLVLMNSLFKSYGPDSYVGRIASVLQGSTDTTIYILGLYFSSIGIKKIRYSLIVGLLADLSAIILSIIFINIFFYS